MYTENHTNFHISLYVYIEMSMHVILLADGFMHHLTFAYQTLWNVGCLPPRPPYFNIEGLTHLLMYGAAEWFMHHLALPMGKSCFDKKANFQY